MQSTITIVHHTEASIHGGLSPFAEAISDIVEGEDVRIACPYIGIDYISEILVGCPSWRILTDAEEFITSNRGSARRATIEFITEHPEAVRHVKNLHAKVVIAGDKALVGSANLTGMGLAGRDEMAVLFEGTAHVRELERWFDNLWAEAGDLDPGDLARFADAIPIAVDTPDATFHLPSPTRLVHATLRAPGEAGEKTTEARERLVKKLRQAPDRAWADHYLDLVAELVEATGLDGDDPRLVMSIPQGPELPVTVCQRYVLAAFRKRQPVLSMILPHQPELLDGLHVVRWGNGFRPRKHESNVRGPYCVSMEVADPAAIPDGVKDAWRELVRRELSRGRYSSFKRHHEPIVFQAATDAEFRRGLLDEAFSEKPS
jgi:hypothetical protein